MKVIVLQDNKLYNPIVCKICKISCSIKGERGKTTSFPLLFQLNRQSKLLIAFVGCTNCKNIYTAKMLKFSPCQIYYQESDSYGV